MKHDNWNMTCPFCGKGIYYWPNYSSNTSSDYGNVEWIEIGKGQRKKKQFFHRDCFYKTCPRYLKEQSK